jgi:hypothetical protein
LIATKSDIALPDVRQDEYQEHDGRKAEEHYSADLEVGTGINWLGHEVLTRGSTNRMVWLRQCHDSFSISPNIEQSSFIVPSQEQ